MSLDAERKKTPELYSGARLLFEFEREPLVKAKPENVVCLFRTPHTKFQIRAGLDATLKTPAVQRPESEDVLKAIMLFLFSLAPSAVQKGSDTFDWAMALLQNIRVAARAATPHQRMALRGAATKAIDRCSAHANPELASTATEVLALFRLPS